ncbi:MAG: hypothetical protein P1P86_13985 [Bacteroidales bacterium]|nr:hypothetical protein [Bacteroidales bacterium]
MKRYKAVCVILLAMILFLTPWRSTMKAQTYSHAAGIRAGYSSGISYKGFRLHRMSAFEVDVLYNRHGFNLGALYEYHLKAFQSRRTFFYLGGGAFGGDWKEVLSLGVAAVAGIEYTLRDLPLNFSIDWKPMLNIYARFEPDFLDLGLSVRYRFGR